MMKLISVLIITSALALSACKEDVVKNHNGTFDIKVDGTQTEFYTYLDSNENTGGITIRAGGLLSSIKIEGFAGKQNGTPVLPSLSMYLMVETSTSKALDIASINLFTDSIHNPHQSNLIVGEDTLKDWQLGRDGKISFSFTADLVQREKTDSGMMTVEGAPIIHIEGSFSGTIPASELKK